MTLRTKHYAFPQPQEHFKIQRTVKVTGKREREMERGGDIKRKWDCREKEVR